MLAYIIAAILGAGLTTGLSNLYRTIKTSRDYQAAMVVDDKVVMDSIIRDHKEYINATIESSKQALRPVVPNVVINENMVNSEELR